uniref:CHK kinase-like domain-containing protein n=1 Tax=Ceratitis capitata TaxID=7213 RepID=W8B1A9_CERCA
MSIECYNLEPAWLTKEYLETVLRKYKNDGGLQIVHLDIQPASAKGNNYASVMTRLKIKMHLSNNSIVDDSYVLKSSIESDAFSAEVIKDYDLFNTEMFMYDKVLPKLSALLKEIGDCDKIFADTIFVDYEHSAILLEDLAVLHCAIGNRIAGMNELETKATLRSLAKMHAAGAVLNERMPDVLTKLNLGFFHRSTKGLAPYFEGLFEVCANFAGECESLGPYYRDKMLQLKPYVMEFNRKSHEPPESYFQTLLHGDLWTTNILLRDRGEQLKNAILIDFQFSIWSTPAVDLHYFFNTSLPNELRIDRQDELVKCYYDVLADALERLNYGGRKPSLHDICIQMEAGRFYALSSTVVNQSAMINEKTDDAELKNLIGTDETASKFRATLYTNKKVQENIKNLLPYFDRKGLLDIA